VRTHQAQAWSVAPRRRKTHWVVLRIHTLWRSHKATASQSKFRNNFDILQESPGNRFENDLSNGRLVAQPPRDRLDLVRKRNPNLLEHLADVYDQVNLEARPATADCAFLQLDGVVLFPCGKAMTAHTPTSEPTRMLLASLMEYGLMQAVAHHIQGQFHNRRRWPGLSCWDEARSGRSFFASAFETESGFHFNLS